MKVDAIVSEVPLENPVIEAVDGQIVWLRASADPFLVGYDVRSGQPVRRAKSNGHVGQLEDAQHARVGDGWVIAKKSGSTFLQGFNEADDSLWTERIGDGVLLGAWHESVLALEHDRKPKPGGLFRFTKKGGTSLRVLDAKTGKTKSELSIPGSQKVLPPHAVVFGDCAFFVLDEGIIVAVDLNKMKVRWTTHVNPPESIAKLASPLLFAGRDLWLLRAESGQSGAATELVAVAQDTGKLGHSQRFKCKAHRAYGSDGGFLVLGKNRSNRYAEVVALDGKRFELLLHGTACGAAQGNRFVVAEPGCINVIDKSADGFAWSRGPLPEGEVFALSFAGDRICVVVGGELITFVPPSVPQASEAVSFDFALTPSASGVASQEAATVVFAGGSLLSVDHPRYKRITLRPDSGGSGYKRGDKVYFDDVEVAPTGTVTVKAWHREGEAAAKGETAPARLLSADVLEVKASDQQSIAPPAAALADGHNVAALNRMESAFRFVSSPLLRTVVGRYDADVEFRNLLDTLMFEIHIIERSDTWQYADPCLIDLAQEGDGNVFSFYFYPPSADAGAGLAFVEFIHDDSPSVRWMGTTFDEFFAAFLARAVSWNRRMVLQVLDALDLPPGWPKETVSTPPAWFTATHGDADGVEFKEVELAEKKGDLQSAERLLVKALGQTYDDEKAKPIAEHLLKVYDTLGWRYQATILRERAF